MNASFHRLTCSHVGTVLSIFLALGIKSAIGASPANDNFAAAFQFPSVAVYFETNVTGTLVGATGEPEENQVPGLAAWNSRGTIWWKWTCPDAGWATFSPVIPVMDSMAIGVFAGDALTNLTPVIDISTDPFAPSFDAETGVTYWFAAMMAPDSPEPAGEINVGFNYYYSPPIVVITPPVNDNFTNRIALIGTNVSVTSTNTGATTEPGENIGPGWLTLVASVWYSWTAPAAGVVYFSGGATNTDFRFSLGTYRGETLATLTVPTATADGGFYVEAGDTIQLQVASALDPYWHRGGGTGFFTVDVHLVPRAAASSNDLFAQRIDITLPQYHFEGSIYGATDEPGEPIPNPAYQQTLWWRFIAPDDGLIQLVRSAPFENLVAVYEGSTFALMQRLTEASGSRFRVRRGQEYSVQVSSGLVPSGGFSMDTIFRSFSNDVFVGRERLTGTNVSYAGNFTFATAEPGEPTSGATNTVWATWTAPFTGRLTYSPPQSFQFQYLQVFTGADLASLQPVASARSNPYNYDQVFMATEGTDYHFQFSGGADDFAFSFQHVPFLAATNDDFANAEVLLAGVALSCAPRGIADATMQPGEPLHLGNVPQKSLWWKWRAPFHGTLLLDPGLSFVTNVVFAVYQGFSVETLQLVGKATNVLQAPVIGGETYYIAIAAAADATADVMFSGSAATDYGAFVDPGNILREPSWEGTALTPQYWGIAGSLGGYGNQVGGCNGTTWPVLGTGTRIWQDFATIPGHEYRVRFAFRVGGNLSGCCGDAGVRVLWDDRVLGVEIFPESESGFWHSVDFLTTASNATARVTFENIHRNLEMDAFSVVDRSAPPVVVNQPQSVGSLLGGRVNFLAGVQGSSPLIFQWFHNGAPFAGQSSNILTIDPVREQDGGDYFVVVTNAFGAVTSLVATLNVDAPANATILVQPYGDILAVGSYFNISVVAVGQPPLTYQWFHDGQAVSLATNRNLMLTNAQMADAGIYEVRIQNPSSSVVSLPTRLILTNAALGGGFVEFANRFRPGPSGTNESPIFDLDGVTRLTGTNYLAQLYAGPSPESLRPQGKPTSFLSGPLKGIFVPRAVTLPNVPSGATAHAQARVWESAKGTSYEEARVMGGKFGRSPVFTIVPGAPPALPPQTTGLSSFSLQSGLPRFTVGTIQFVERQAGGIMVWAIDGEAGYRYLVEKSSGSADALWRPYVVLTNITGRVTFNDTASDDATTFYRARILD